MSDIGALVERLVQQGIPVAEASEIIALAVAAGAATYPHRKTANAQRQQRWRERNKALRKRYESVTHNADDEALRSVTNRNESVTNNAPSLSLSKEDKLESKRESRATQLPDGWQPPPEAWQAAVDRLGSSQRAEAELLKFKNHALDKGRTSKRWGAAWANWVERAIVYSGGPNGTHQPKPGSVSAAFREIREQLESEAGRGDATGGNPVLRISSG